MGVLVPRIFRENVHKKSVVVYKKMLWQRCVLGHEKMLYGDENAPG